MTGVLCALAAPFAAGGTSGSGGLLTAIATPDTLERTKGTRTSSAAITTAEPAVISVTGGVGPYTYAWTRLNGASAITAQTPAAASTTFGGNVPAESTLRATFNCLVTDSLSATANATVDVELTAVSFTIGGTL